MYLFFIWSLAGVEYNHSDIAANYVSERALKTLIISMYHDFIVTILENYFVCTILSHTPLKEKDTYKILMAWNRGGWSHVIANHQRLCDTTVNIII